VAPVECAIKWPNDVWLDERKLAGVLIEARPPAWAVIGVGVNVAIADDDFPPDVRWPATSIGHDVTVEGMRAALCEALGDWVDAPAPETLEQFRRRDALAGREVSWEGAGTAPGSGRAAAVDERGNLVVELGDGDRLALGSGEVSLRPTTP
jgi:BirA family biotin operon repressor/biotin-[acetyl-CoA-carboxylase] ligase